MMFKHEVDDSEVEDHGVVGMYLMLFKILKLPAIQELALTLLTVKVSKHFTT